MVAARNKTQVEEYAARYVKKCVTGSGAASKDQVQLLVFNLLGIKNPRDLTLDASDALSLAIAHARVFEVNARMKKALENEL